jgi:FkbM family methyltransferase
MIHALLEFAKSIPRGTAPLNLRRLFYRKACSALLADLQPHPRFFSQHGQDRYLDSFVFCGKSDGFFVDVGAYDGVLLSNTFFFERLGWRGICLEPNPRVYEKLARNRSCIALNVGVAAVAEKMRFLSLPEELELGSGFVEFFDQTSQFADEKYIEQVCKQSGRLLNIEAVNLNHLLAQNGVSRVDYLSIDTEGADWEILGSIDFDRFDIDVVSVESVRLGDRIASHMKKKGYRLIAILGADEIYRKERT